MVAVDLSIGNGCGEEEHPLYSFSRLCSSVIFHAMLLVHVDTLVCGYVATGRDFPTSASSFIKHLLSVCYVPGTW